MVNKKTIKKDWRNIEDNEKKPVKVKKIKKMKFSIMATDLLEILNCIYYPFNFSD